MDPIKSKTSMLHFSEAHFEKNLAALKNTQESIQSLSNWCLQHKQHHKKIVNCWFKVMKKVKMETRLTLFYLANDVIQYSRRKNIEFVHTWALFLQRAVTLVRDDKIKPNIQRIFKIWADRGIFDETFIADLNDLLESPKGVSSDTAKLVAEFQPMKLIDKIRSCTILENDTDLKLSNLKQSSLELTDVDALRNNLKDRRHGADLVTEVGDGILKIEAYVASLNEEIKDRAKLIEFLEQGSVFYEHQKGEAKIVVNAYRNFGSRVKNLKRKLDEMVPLLPSPVPSPDINAPSPSPDSDAELELPGDNKASEFTSVFVSTLTLVQYSTGVAGNCYNPAVPMDAYMPSSNNMGGSFMGSGALPFDIKANLFQEANSHASRSNSDVSAEGKPIEVINSCSKPSEGFNISEFLKSLNHMDASAQPSEPNIPGLSAEVQVEQVRREVITAGNKSQYAQVESFGQSLYSMFSAPPPPPPSINQKGTPALQPPPIPPEMFMGGDGWSGFDENADQSAAPWNTKLPPKFPTWGESEENWDGDSPKDWESESMGKISKLMDETPMSPPMFEKEGFNEPVQYDDRVGTIAEDVDHRTLMGRAGKKDVDHRNLISLTGSPAAHKPQSPTPASKNDWNKFDSQNKDLDFRVLPPAQTSQPARKNEIMMTGETDQDYRNLPAAPIAMTPESPNPNDKGSGSFSDNVESVDMEMSDEENGGDGPDGRRGDARKHSEKNKGGTQQKTIIPPEQPNGLQQNTAVGPRPLLSMAVVRPPGVTPAPTVSQKTPPVQSPTTPISQKSKPPLLPTPPAIPPFLQSVALNPEPLKNDEVNKETTVQDDNCVEEEWEDESDQLFVERMQAEDSFEEDCHKSQMRRGGQMNTSPRSRGRRGNQMGSSGNNFGAPRRVFDYAHAPRGGTSTGYSGGRGYRGSSYRPFRGPRRGHFSRW
ncbi:hypothetical protein B566_EDAN006566 [Ephemera danica]|nr:hypothetical protein B566_EDAN006566 [Ephemera danica]